MVEKKLNFNQPILSVRRCSPKMASHIDDQSREGLRVIHWLPPHILETSSDPVRSPGSIPFLWEQSPGQPKQEILAQSHDYARPLVSIELPLSTKTEALQEETSRNFDASSEPDALIHEQEEERRRVVDQEKAVVLHCRPKFEREGSEQHENVITVCYLLPRSCLKSSVFNLNPVPAMSRVMTFLSESAVSGSSTDNENEYAVMQPLGPFHEEGSCKKSFKTLQELLADDGVKNVLREDDDDDDGESDVKTSGETKIIEDSDSDWKQDSGCGNDILLAVNKAAENARKRVERGSVFPPPPLPESPSDSWLSRTLSASASGRKTSSSAFMYRFNY